MGNGNGVKMRASEAAGKGEKDEQKKRYKLRQRFQLLAADALIALGCRVRSDVVGQARTPRVQIQIK